MSSTSNTEYIQTKDTHTSLCQINHKRKLTVKLYLKLEDKYFKYVHLQHAEVTILLMEQCQLQ